MLNGLFFKQFLLIDTFIVYSCELYIDRELVKRRTSIIEDFPYNFPYKLNFPFYEELRGGLKFCEF